MTTFADRDANHGIEGRRLFHPLLFPEQMHHALARPERNFDLLQIGLRQHAEGQEIDFVLLKGNVRGRATSAIPQATMSP
jgi:hypothetical protein